MIRNTVAVACVGALGAVQATPDSDAAACSSAYALSMMDSSILQGQNSVGACGAIIQFSRCLGRLSNSGASNLAAQQQILDAANAHFSCDYASYVEPPTLSTKDANLEVEVDEHHDVVFHRMRRETISVWDLNAQVSNLEDDFVEVQANLNAAMVDLEATVDAKTSTIQHNTEVAAAAQNASVSEALEAVVSTVTATIDARCNIATQYVKITATGSECADYSARCGVGHYESKAPTLYSDRECSEVNDCSFAGGYKTGQGPTYTFPGNCSAFKQMWFTGLSGYDMYPVKWPQNLRYHQRYYPKVCAGEYENNPVPFKNMKPWRDQWPRFNDNGGRDGSWENYAFRRSGYTLGSHDIQYKFRCTVQQHNCHHHIGQVVRNSIQLNDDLLDMGFEANQCPVMGMVYYHSGHNGDHCSYLRMCIGSRGSPIRNSDQRNSRCNHDWRQLPQRHLDAPDYVLCSVNTPHANPEGEWNHNPLSLNHNYNV
jgi:hypothetical protein